MSIRDYFIKNIMNHVSTGTNTKIIGSFSRDYKYPTDVDVYCEVENNDYDKFMKKIQMSYDNLIFIYVTLLIDLYKNIKIEVEDKYNFDNIDFVFIQKELTRLFNEKMLSLEIFNKLIGYTNDRTLENVLRLELELNTKKKIKWYVHDIKKGYKIINGLKYNFKEMFETEDTVDTLSFQKNYGTAYVMHWIWLYENTFFMIDVGAVSKSKINNCVKWSNRTYSFYKDSFILYYEKDYYYLLKSLIYVAIHERNFKIVNELHKILEYEYGIHKQAFNKLYEINKLKSDDFKDAHLDNILTIALNTVKDNLKKINFKYNDNETILENRRRLINFTNDSIKVYYNKFKHLLINRYRHLKHMLPPDF